MQAAALPLHVTIERGFWFAVRKLDRATSLSAILCHRLCKEELLLQQLGLAVRWNDRLHQTPKVQHLSLEGKASSRE